MIEFRDNTIAFNHETCRMLSLTTEQILSFAPDEASVKAARGLARPAKWATAGQNAGVLWGECKGSALYQVCADPAAPADLRAPGAAQDAAP